MAGGEVGAADAIDASGRHVVVKWQWPAVRAASAARRGSCVARLGSRGALLPAYLVVEPIGEGVLVIHERMFGTPSDTVPATLLDDLVAHNLVQTGATAGGTGWDDYVRSSPLLGLEGYCEQGSLQGRSSAIRDLLTRIRAAGDSLAEVKFVDDAVHLIFTTATSSPWVDD